MADDDDRLLTGSEVAVMFRVNPKTVSRWGAAGRLPFVRTLGGHRRYPKSGVLALLADGAHTTAAGTPISAADVPKAIIKAAWDAKLASRARSADGACLDALAAALTQARADIAQLLDRMAGEDYRNAAHLVRGWPQAGGTQ